MQGIVKGISKNRQRIAVETDYGYTVFDVDGAEINLGNIITGDLDDHGSCVLKNQSTGENIYAYIEAIQATKSAARDLLNQS